MNPLEDTTIYNKYTNFFGKNLLGSFIPRKKYKSSSYSKMKTNQIKKRRAKNKAGYKSRRLNRIIAKNLHAKLV